MGLGGILILGGFIFVCVWIFPNEKDGSRYDFAWHRHDLEVKYVTVTVRTEDTNANYYDVTGLLTNKGRIPWRVDEIELSITNSQGTPDVLHVNLDNSFVVQPNTEHGFGFHKWTSLTNVVIAAHARVENAGDGNALEK